MFLASLPMVFLLLYIYFIFVSIQMNFDISQHLVSLCSMLYYNFVSIKHISQLYLFVSNKDFQRNEIYQKTALFFEQNFSEARTATKNE